MNVIDIPPQDMSSDFIILAERRRIEAEMAQRLQVGRPGSMARIMVTEGGHGARLLPSSGKDRHS